MPVTLAQSLSLLIRTLSNCKRLKQKTTFGHVLKCQGSIQLQALLSSELEQHLQEWFFPTSQLCVPQVVLILEPMEGVWSLAAPGEPLVGARWLLQLQLYILAGSSSLFKWTLHSSSARAFPGSPKICCNMTDLAMGPLLKQSPWSAGNDLRLI